MLCTGPYLSPVPVDTLQIALPDHILSNYSWIRLMIASPKFTEILMRHNPSVRWTQDLEGNLLPKLGNFIFYDKLCSATLLPLGQLSTTLGAYSSSMEGAEEQCHTGNGRGKQKQGHSLSRKSCLHTCTGAASMADLSDVHIGSASS